MKKKCEICGKTYEYCPSCPRDMLKPTWMHRFDNEKCKNLWDVLCDNGIGNATDIETAEALKAMNYQSMTIENESIKAHIAKVMNGAANPVTEDFMNPPVEVEAETVEETIEAEIAEADGSDVVETTDTTEAEAIENAFELAMDEIAGEEVKKPKKRKGFRH